MNTSEIRSSLARHSVDLRERFNVRELFLFGSVVRNEQTSMSDVDMLVRFNDKASFDGYMDLKFFLEELLGADIDLVTEKGLNTRLRSRILQEAVRVA